MKLVVFTDLDGTLLDHKNYSYKDAKESIKILKDKKIPIIFCTSKNRFEIEYWREKIKIFHPFISENGGAIYISKKYFDFSYEVDKEMDEYNIVELGIKYEKLVSFFNKLKSKYDLISFDDMSVEDISEDANLSISQAELAKKREYSLPFKILKDEYKENIFSEIKKSNFKYTKGGRYYHLMGDNDKGRAVKILIDLYKKKYGEINSIGIGDSKNDFAMLDIVDRGILVKKTNGSYASDNYDHVDGIGPKGWSKIIKKLFF